MGKGRHFCLHPVLSAVDDTAQNPKTWTTVAASPTPTVTEADRVVER